MITRDWDFYAGWALHQTGKIYSDYYGSQGSLYYLLIYVSQGGFFFAIFEWLALVAGVFLLDQRTRLTEQGDQAEHLVTIFTCWLQVLLLVEAMRLF